MLLLLTAAEAEADAVARGLEPDLTLAPVRVGPYPARGARGVTVLAGGIGPAAAAAATATALCCASVEAVLSVGVAGGFGLAAGTLVVASEIVSADLGAHSPDGWLGLAELGWPEQATLRVEGAQALADALAAALTHEESGAEGGTGAVRTGPVRCGPVLTVSAMTGTAARAGELLARHGALAEAMEGAGAALAATRHGCRVGEVRAICNEVGPRDRPGWDMAAALAALERSAPTLVKEWQ